MHMESSLSDDSNSNVQVSKNAIIGFIDELQGNLDNIKPLEVANKYIKFLENEWKADATAASEREQVVGATAWMMEVIVPQLRSVSAQQSFLETALPLLQDTTTCNLAQLDQLVNVAAEHFGQTALLLSGLIGVVQSCQHLLQYAQSCSTESASPCMPSFAPCLLLDLLLGPLSHCHLNDAWYEDKGEAVKESYSCLLTTSLDAATSLLGCISTVCHAAAAAVSASILMKVSEVCRVLSSMSHMKGVVGGWKSITETCTALKGSSEVQAYINEGLDVKALVTQLSVEFQEGLELLYSLLPQQQCTDDVTASQETVVRRVVRMCAMCSKVTFALADTFLAHCGAPVVHAVLHFALTLSRCCVCVALLEAAPDVQVAAVLGAGQSQQLVLALQLLVSVLAPHPHFSLVLLEAAADWMQTTQGLEAAYLKLRPNFASDVGNTSSLMSTWCSMCTAPLLLLHHTAMALSDVFACQQVLLSVQQLPCVLLAVLLHYVPYCSAAFNSCLGVRCERRDGAAAEHLSLYSTSAVAASVALVLVPTQLWPLVQHMLLAGVCLQFQSVGVRCSDDERTTPHFPVVLHAAYTALQTRASSAPVDPWWTHALAADLVIFLARVGSGELCCGLYSSLCQLSGHAPQCLQPYLALLLLRLHSCLPSQPADHVMTCWKDLPLLLLCHLSSAVIFDDSKNWQPNLRGQCLKWLSSVCAETEKSIIDLLNTSQGTLCERVLLQLEEHLQCLHALLLRRSDACAEAAALSAVAAALAQLWQRLPAECVGSSGGDWLLARLATVSSHITDLWTDHQVLAALRVCGRRVQHQSARPAPGRAGVWEAAMALWKCLAQRCFALSSLPHITDAFGGLCSALVSEEYNPWLCQLAFQSFVHFARQSPHKEIVAAILQRCAPEVKARLQKFILGKPHPVPPDNPSDSAHPSTGDVPSNGGSLPLFLFHQQCITNSKRVAGFQRSCFSSSYSENGNTMEKNICASKVGAVSEIIPPHSRDEQKSCSGFENATSDINRPTKRPPFQPDSLLVGITRNLFKCKDLIQINQNMNSDIVSEEHMVEALKYSESLLESLEMAFGGSVKRVKPDVCS